MNWHEWKDVAVEVIAGCSFLHTILPPWDWEPDFVVEGLADFPNAQATFRACFHNRYYKLFIYIIGYVALNARSTVWKFISVKNPVGPNYNTPPEVK